MQQSSQYSSLVETHSFQQRQLYFLCKRLLDIVLATLFLVGLAPLLAIVAILIVMDSQGSPFFYQQRVGSKRRTIDGRETWEIGAFRLYKPMMQVITRIQQY
jgi:lipopolysaccharide/colanic/teichoic acid biosynthesis glycosyltransferase